MGNRWNFNSLSENFTGLSGKCAYSRIGTACCRDFYRAMEAGELSDLDDGEEPRFHDFLEWHGLYKIWTSISPPVSNITASPRLN